MGDRADFAAAQLSTTGTARDKCLQRPEIVRRIIIALHKPAPRPNNGASYMDIRQPDLAACMQVSVMFNKVTSPILYRHVITDDFGLFMEGYKQKRDDRAAHGGILSKRLLVGLVKHLSLEYPAFGTAITYTQLMCGSLGVAQPSQTDLGPHDFPFLLDSFTACAYLGGHVEEWSVHDRIITMGVVTVQLRNLLTKLLVIPARPKHICLRNTTGFMSLDTNITPTWLVSADRPAPTVTAHMQRWITVLPLNVATSATYVHERPYNAVRAALKPSDWQNKRYASKPRLFTAGWPKPFNLDLAYDEEVADVGCFSIAQGARIIANTLVQHVTTFKRAGADVAPKSAVEIKLFGSSDTGFLSGADRTNLVRLTEAEQVDTINGEEAAARRDLGSLSRIVSITADLQKHAPVCSACGV